MHVEKYSRSAVGHMLRHYNRDVLHFSNKTINHMKSDYNYNLAPNHGMDDISYYCKRLSQVKCQNRADVKTLCDWVITLPKQSFSEKQEQQFFKLAYDFMALRYGEKNTISAWVHNDEDGQPHMHFCFIPVCIDKKKQIEKVSAKEVITRNDLRIIHREMSEHMECFFGHNVGILNGATLGGNKTVMELKTKSLQENVDALENVKNQTIVELAKTIEKRPSLISDITRSIKIVMGKEQPPFERNTERQPERSR